jgi:hypothetical protein
VSFKRGLLVISTALLASTPMKAMPERLTSAPVGVVMEISRGRMDAHTAREGAAIYDGDLLETQSDMTLQARVCASQILLQSNSSVEVRRLSKGFSAELLHGSIAISSAEGETFQVRADGANISPIGTEPTAVQITWISANAILLGSSRGRIEVSMGDEVSRLDPGTFYRLEIRPGDIGPQNNPQPGTEHGDSGDHGPHQTPHPTARSHFVWFVISALGAVAGVVIWRALVSPSAP